MNDGDDDNDNDVDEREREKKGHVGWSADYFAANNSFINKKNLQQEMGKAIPFSLLVKEYLGLY